ncbi:hypothetical protein BJF92_13660 [Rhizobium rhizosphaerae]|uniref:Uncharacterized protein n=1 Tax=Xaviernesmea rhizosphaerae TaxID=1672749 RepID=A0A1Q9AI15_9HYPH|nr:hypothetical protein [Xaviernesmea rhizosphaerae]OLP54851.1 hypothetical protein BJF92_13660 [Xaviernesmea rhizosphaerae]
MLQKTVRTVDINNPAFIMTPFDKWAEAVAYVRAEIAWSNPISSIQAAVDFAIKRGIAAKETAYERREALQNIILGTGWHLDRKNRVRRLSALVSIVEPSLSDEGGRPCVRFKIGTTIEGGKTSLSRETLEWLDADGSVVATGRHLDRNVEAIVESSRALDAYMTDVEAAVYRDLAFAVEELRHKRVSIVITRASENSLRVVFELYVERKWVSTSVGARLVSADCVRIAALDADADTAIKKAARDIDVSPESLSEYVRKKLDAALCDYEYWNRDEELEQAELEGKCR